MGRIAFIGGIHGAGKGTLCKEICSTHQYIHLTASQLIHWVDISGDNNKKVNNISSTQDRLITGLKKTIEPEHNYLLDGHFCLLNARGQPERIPIDTFVKIAPDLIALVVTDISIAKERLYNRDSKNYEFDLLNRLQLMEQEYAYEIATLLNVPCVEIVNEDSTGLINHLERI